MYLNLLKTTQHKHANVLILKTKPNLQADFLLLPQLPNALSFQNFSAKKENGVVCFLSASTIRIHC